jgi:hypothetical protein
MLKTQRNPFFRVLEKLSKTRKAAKHDKMRHAFWIRCCEEYAQRTPLGETD